MGALRCSLRCLDRLPPMDVRVTASHPFVSPSRRRHPGRCCHSNSMRLTTGLIRPRLERISCKTKVSATLLEFLLADVCRPSGSTCSARFVHLSSCLPMCSPKCRASFIRALFSCRAITWNLIPPAHNGVQHTGNTCSAQLKKESCRTHRDSS